MLFKEATASFTPYVCVKPFKKDIYYLFSY